MILHAAADLPLRRFFRAARRLSKISDGLDAFARGSWQAAERRRSGCVLGRVDLAHAGQRERAGAGQVDAQFQGTAGSFHEPAQGGEVEVGLALDLDDGRLLDAKTLGDLLLAALGELAQGLEAFNVSLKLRRPLGDARLALGRHGAITSLSVRPRTLAFGTLAFGTLAFFVTGMLLSFQRLKMLGEPGCGRGVGHDRGSWSCQRRRWVDRSATHARHCDRSPLEDRRSQGPASPGVDIVDPAADETGRGLAPPLRDAQSRRAGGVWLADAAQNMVTCNCVRSLGASGAKRPTASSIRVREKVRRQNVDCELDQIETSYMYLKRDTGVDHMAHSAMLHVRLDDEIKAKGNAALAAMGLSAADAVRLLYHRIVAEQAFPLELKVPNVATLDAMAEADAIIAERAARYDDGEAMIGALNG